MKRSEINCLIKEAQQCFGERGFALPPNPKWDVTDFGLGNWQKCGLVLVNLTEEPEYCEKLMYAKRGMVTPAHHHYKKKEDIICRFGVLSITVRPKGNLLKQNGEPYQAREGETIVLDAGERVTIWPGVVHEFWPLSEVCIIGEVSTANDDESDNCFVDQNVGRFPGIEEDEDALVVLVSDAS